MALPTADDALEAAPEMAEEADERTELAPELAEEAASEAEDPAEEAASEAEDPASEAPLSRELEALARDSDADPTAPLEKIVVLPTVLVMVLPSVVMVERISEVAIATRPSGASVSESSESVAVAVSVSVGLDTVPEAVTAVTAALGLEKEPVEAEGPLQYAPAKALIGPKSVPGGQDWAEQSRTP